MKEFEIEIEVLAEFENPPIDREILDAAIFVEAADLCLCASRIKVSGKYNRAYTIVAFLETLNGDRVLIDGDFLIVCLFSNILVIDMKSDRLFRNIDLDCWELFSIFKFKSGYIVHGEGETRFLNQNFDVVWEKSCCDIFVNPKAEKDFVVFEDYVVAYDWYGYKHYYDESGEFLCEHYPAYSMD